MQARPGRPQGTSDYNDAFIIDYCHEDSPAKNAGDSNRSADSPFFQTACRVAVKEERKTLEVHEEEAAVSGDVVTGIGYGGARKHAEKTGRPTRGKDNHDGGAEHTVPYDSTLHADRTEVNTLGGGAAQKRARRDSGKGQVDEGSLVAESVWKRPSTLGVSVDPRLLSTPKQQKKSQENRLSSKIKDSGKVSAHLLLSPRRSPSHLACL